MDKPFIFGIPVEDTHFIGREKEIQRLSTNFKYGVNTILLSPRRWGKTSLVNKVAGLVASKDLVVVKMDIFSCRNEYDFYNTFSAAILKQTASRIEEWKDLAKGFIEKLTPKISLSPDPNSEYSVSLGITSKTHTPEELLEFPETIAKRKGCHIVVCIDEFQQVGEFPDSLNVQKRMRTVWQHQSNVSYCLYGSKMHMMTNLFQKKSYPFYKFGEVQYLKAIPLSAWTIYISDRFEREKKHISEALIEQLCESVEYQSSYVQQLAYNVFLLTETGVTESILRQALEDLVDQNSAIFIEQVQSLTTYQLNFLRAVLAGNHNGFGEKEIRENYDLGVPSNIVRLKRSLIDKELIEITKDGVIIGDPVLRFWLKKVL
ncbi:MAG: ATP-binding protein [Bacteroidaceae bacterium]|nr:ATP-binding protein [Bacteroidaceae bacterium]